MVQPGNEQGGRLHEEVLPPSLATFVENVVAVPGISVLELADFLLAHSKSNREGVSLYLDSMVDIVSHRYCNGIDLQPPHNDLADDPLSHSGFAEMTAWLSVATSHDPELANHTVSEVVKYGIDALSRNVDPSNDASDTARTITELKSIEQLCTDLISLTCDYTTTPDAANQLLESGLLEATTISPELELKLRAHSAKLEGILAKDKSGRSVYTENFNRMWHLLEQSVQDGQPVSAEAVASLSVIMRECPSLFSALVAPTVDRQEVASDLRIHAAEQLLQIDPKLFSDDHARALKNIEKSLQTPENVQVYTRLAEAYREKYGIVELPMIDNLRMMTLRSKDEHPEDDVSYSEKLIAAFSSVEELVVLIHDHPNFLTNPDAKDLSIRKLAATKDPFYISEALALAPTYNDTGETATPPEILDTARNFLAIYEECGERQALSYAREHALRIAELTPHDEQRILLSCYVGSKRHGHSERAADMLTKIESNHQNDQTGTQALMLTTQTLLKHAMIPEAADYAHLLLDMKNEDTKNKEPLLATIQAFVDAGDVESATSHAVLGFITNQHPNRSALQAVDIIAGRTRFEWDESI